MEVAGNLGARFTPLGLVAENDPPDFDFVLNPPTAMVGEARIVIAYDPGPVEARGQIRKQRPGLLRQTIASEAVVETITEAKEARRASALHLGGKRGQRRVRIIGWEKLSESREPACLFQMQIGDQQRLLQRPIERAVGCCRERFACERKGNHEPALTPAHRSI